MRYSSWWSDSWMEKFFSQKVKSVCVCNLCSCFCHSIGVCVCTGLLYSAELIAKLREFRSARWTVQNVKCAVQKRKDFVSRTEKSDVLARRFSRSSTAETVTAAKVSTLPLLNHQHGNYFLVTNREKNVFNLNWHFSLLIAKCFRAKKNFLFIFFPSSYSGTSHLLPTQIMLSFFSPPPPPPLLLPPPPSFFFSDSQFPNLIWKSIFKNVHFFAAAAPIK